MRDYAVIIPNRYPDHLRRLLDSIEKYCPDDLGKVWVIADGHTECFGRNYLPYNREKFCYAESVNMGINQFTHEDIILLNDDCVVEVYDFFSRLCVSAYEHRKVGIISPLIKGCVGNPIQRYHEFDSHWGWGELIKFEYTLPVCFPCVYLKRQMINEIGVLSESFKGYGGEDDEYCHRARMGDWRTAINSELIITHGDGSSDLNEGRGRSWSVSFVRRERE